MIEREVEYTPAPDRQPTTAILVRISEIRSDGRDWSAVLEILGFPEQYRQTFYGTDSMSAVLSAVQMAPVVLRSLAGQGTLTWLGDADLGFHLPPL